PGYNFALHAINPDGSSKWIHPVDSWIYWSSPAISAADGTVYIGSFTQSNFSLQQGKVYAVNPDGSRKWTQTTAGKVDSSPAIGKDGLIYIGSDDGKIQAINSADGSLKWEYATGGPVTNSSAIDEQGNLYIGSYDGKLYCLGE
ncbi:MAG: pyrrolo-quinoline quinone, partial [Candidatus Portnoybacteria bacterium CG_4_10_14_0_2_um_filter_44_20]